MNTSKEQKKYDKRIYIIRHGETDLNKNGIVQGRGIDSDLNDTGISQGVAFFNYYKGIEFDKIYTSTLKRTHQTVAKFMEKGTAWQQMSGLDELAWGKYEGQKSTPELREAFKGLIHAWANGHYDVKTDGGESPNEVYIRQAKAIEEILKQKEEKTILVCMHGRAMRLLMCLLMQKSLNNMDDYPHQNTSLYIVDYEYDSNLFHLNTFNSLEHLHQS
jgi:broad specificity phosphatase PhoE